ncbi:isoprenoid synthase domain-containing protein [Armillaria luteobubalina]|uniref:Isoprenoid synthase domain-containing protein n=1 Tax=Armillaria luteobubalina TaxID=153913 RepID=A0AA39UWY5_9AGAR|nr:isoprenoid synthase domain-containing protein [Armillaria luteobubalina]
MSFSLASSSHAGPHSREVQPRLSALSNLVRRLRRYVKPPNHADFQQKSKQTAEDIIRSFVHRFDTSNKLPSVSDPTLEDLCFKEAERRGYALDMFRPQLTLGINIAASAYHHLLNVDVKVYIVFFTAFVTYLDDAYPDDPDIRVGVPNFTKNFLSLENQPSKMLSDLANLLTETYQLFGEVTSDFIVHSVLKFMTALILEARITHQRRQTHKIEKYAIFLRELSGIADAYIEFIFPTELPYSVYIEAFPCLREVVCFMNDITSFYKEECAGENHNLVTLLAEARGVSKVKILSHLVEKCMEAHHGTLLILLPHKEARRLYEQFVLGYLTFYLGAKRYRLSELNL